MVNDRADAEKLVARLVDVADLTSALAEDVLAAEQALGEASPQERRAYVRAVFALAEGALSGMSTYLLEGQSLAGWALEPLEERAFWDAVADPSRPRPDGKGRPTLTERTKLVFKAGTRLFGCPPLADFGGVPYQQYQRAIAVRDRLMHPKRRAHLTVQDAEVGEIREARLWFSQCGTAFFQAATEEVKVRARAAGGKTSG